jgi:hypothetical protein
MATTTNITTTYAGEAAGQYISAALLSASTIENGGITVRPNVMQKEVIQRIDVDAIVKDATCDFTPTSTVDLTERILTVEEAQVNLQLCKKDFVTTWEVAQMGANSGDVPSSLADYMIGHIGSKVAQKIEQNIWSGVAANSGEFDGLAVQIAADAALPAAQEITAIAITAANVAAEMAKVVAVIPSAVYGKEDLKLYVSKNVYKAYIEHLAGYAAAGVGANGYENRGSNQRLVDLFFNGIPVFVAEGLTDNKMVAAQTSNLFFGTSLLSAMQEVKLLDMADLDGSNNFRFIARFFQGATYGVVEDIVLYA